MAKITSPLTGAWIEERPTHWVYMANTTEAPVEFAFVQEFPNGTAAFRPRRMAVGHAAPSLRVAQLAAINVKFGIVGYDVEGGVVVCEHCREPIEDWDKHGPCEALAHAEAQARNP